MTLLASFYLWDTGLEKEFYNFNNPALKKRLSTKNLSSLLASSLSMIRICDIFNPINGRCKKGSALISTVLLIISKKVEVELVYNLCKNKCSTKKLTACNIQQFVTHFKVFKIIIFGFQ